MSEISALTPFCLCDNRFARLLLLLLLSCFLATHPSPARASSVVIYTSQDEEYADPTFREFEKETGIKVLPVYDSEAVKTVGLVNRLLHEQSHPQCDVFWNNEEMRTRMLAARGLFRETNGWVLTGWRSRRLVVNTNLLPVAQAPRTFAEATNAIWRGKFALAYPLFGTTATHFQALRQHSGDAPWQAWCRALNANKPMLVDGNSVVVKLRRRRRSRLRVHRLRRHCGRPARGHAHRRDAARR